MIEFIKSKKGYFYKLLKNGEKKRISQDEYNKKRKNKKMTGGAGEPIEEDDIMYQDDLVCILKPEVKKGIIVFSRFTQPSEMDSLCTKGLKTGQQLQKEGINFGRKIYHPYIFFRAPYYSRPIDYTSIETEINSSYGKQANMSSRVYIRVDPDRTFVFSSEIRNFFKHSRWSRRIDQVIENSKKTLSEYLTIIKNNERIEQIAEYNKNQKIWYDLFTSKAELRPKIELLENTIFDDNPIYKNSEILVSIPHLTPNFFVLCIPPLPPSPPSPLLPEYKPRRLKQYFPFPIPTSHPSKINNVWNPIKGKWISPKHKKWMKEGYPNWYSS